MLLMLSLGIMGLSACEDFDYPRDPNNTLERVLATGCMRVAAVDHVPWVIVENSGSPRGAVTAHKGAAHTYAYFTERLIVVESLPWVQGSESHLREEGRFLSGAIYVRPRGERIDPSWIHDAEIGLSNLDWRVGHVLISPVPDLEEVSGGNRRGRERHERTAHA